MAATFGWEFVEILEKRSSLPICGGFSKKSGLELQQRVGNRLPDVGATMGCVVDKHLY